HKIIRRQNVFGRFQNLHLRSRNGQYSSRTNSSLSFDGSTFAFLTADLAGDKSIFDISFSSSAHPRSKLLVRTSEVNFSVSGAELFIECKSLQNSSFLKSVSWNWSRGLPVKSVGPTPKSNGDTRAFSILLESAP